MNKLLVGKALRQLMISKGRPPYMVFQNSYYTGTRTVKCYRPHDPAVEMDLRLSIALLMKAFGVKDYQVNFTRPSQYGAAGFIVKF